MKYLSVEECLRRNAERLEAKALWQTDMGFDEHARRTFCKAIRYHKQADWLLFELRSPIFAEEVAIFAQCVANSILEGQAKGPSIDDLITKK